MKDNNQVEVVTLYSPYVASDRAGNTWGEMSDEPDGEWVHVAQHQRIVAGIIAECWKACGGNGPANLPDLITALRLMDEAEDEQERTVTMLAAKIERIQQLAVEENVARGQPEGVVVALLEDIAKLEKSIKEGYLPALSDAHECINELRAQQQGVVMPEYERNHAGQIAESVLSPWNAALDEVARLNADPLK